MTKSLPDSISQYASTWKAFSVSIGAGGLFLLLLTIQYGYEGSFQLLHYSWGPLWDSIMPHVTHLADGAMAGGAFGVLYSRKKPALVTGLLVSLFLVALSVALLKQGVFDTWHRPASILGADDVQLLSLGKETRFSFPSGHSAAAACLGWYIASAWTRTIWGAAVGVTAVFLGFTRIYIGVHFPGDVAAGLAVGLLMALVGTLFSRRLEILLNQKSPLFQNRTGIILTAVSLLFLVLGVLNTLTKYYLS